MTEPADVTAAIIERIVAHGCRIIDLGCTTTDDVTVWRTTIARKGAPYRVRAFGANDLGAVLRKGERWAAGKFDTTPLVEEATP